jgi:hypothetical protein
MVGVEAQLREQEESDHDFITTAAAIADRGTVTVSVP